MSRQRIRTSVLESSTEKCVHCGGTGHVRSVSSVSLQLLRALEEALLKGPTHNLIVRTRPEIALYVLNQKRAHLSALEERFRIAITINADAEVGGQTGFVIDRGEQVMSPEQAKSLVAQVESAGAVLVEEDEPELTEDIDAADEATEPGEDGETPAETPDLMQGEPSAEGEGGRDEAGRRRRRRRRGRGGRGGDRAGQFQHDQRPAAPGDAPYEQMAETAAPAGEDFAPESQPVPASEHGFGHGDEGRRHEGNGEHRGRRRRGRRGGRRNRRDRDDQPYENNGGPSREQHEHYGSPEYQPQHREMAHTPEPAPPPAIEQAHVAAPPPLPPAPATPEPPPAAEAPRRRSTVREPAPIFRDSTPPIPTPAQPSPPPPVVVTSSADDDAAKPRRTGWWAKRLMGGDKG
jgi:ribonuclease E